MTYLSIKRLNIEQSISCKLIYYDSCENPSRLYVETDVKSKSLIGNVKPQEN